MPNPRTEVVLFSLSVAAVLVVSFLYFNKRKKKSNDPPDKKKDSVKQKPENNISSDAPSRGSNLEMAVGTGIAGTRKSTEYQQKSMYMETSHIQEKMRVVTKVEAGTTVSEKGSAPMNKNGPLAKNYTVVPEDGSGDHCRVEAPIVEETVQVVNAMHAESVPSVPNVGLTLNDKTSELKKDQAVLDHAVSSNEPQEEILSPINAQGLNSSPETASLHVIENGDESNIQVTEQMLENKMPKLEQVADLEQIVKNNVGKNASTNPSNVIKETASSEIKPVVQKTSNTSECSDGQCDMDLKCKTSEDSLTKSWHEEMDEQCDNNLGLSNNTPDLTSSRQSPVPESQRNGVSSEHEVSEESVSRSPERTKHKKADEAQTGSDSSSNCDNLSEASNDSGKGGSVTENSHQSSSASDEERVYEFNIPSDICGLFIGTRGKTIKTIRDLSGARIRLRNNPYTPEYQICVIEGPQSAIDKALTVIKRKFPSLKYPGMDLTQIVTPPVVMPDIMQLGLPEGVSMDIVVSSIVDAGRVFVQQPTHPSFPSLERLNAFMNQCYLQDGAVPDIPKPIESGVICAAPMLNGWYRAQIMSYYDATDECDIKYVDYGGYSHITSQCLKQIRSDFMTLPFQAVECYLGNITPLENESFFSAEAAVVLEELTHGKLLQAQVVGRAEDGIPYVHIYQINGTNSALLVNRELVNRGVARWLELMS